MVYEVSKGALKTVEFWKITIAIIIGFLLGRELEAKFWDMFVTKVDALGVPTVPANTVVPLYSYGSKNPQGVSNGLYISDIMVGALGILLIAIGSKIHEIVKYIGLGVIMAIMANEIVEAVTKTPMGNPTDPLEKSLLGLRTEAQSYNALNELTSANFYRRV